MNASTLRSIVVSVLLVSFAVAACNRSGPRSSVTTTPVPSQDPGITIRAPDAFYDPPPNSPSRPGSLIRDEALKDVLLPPGMRGWRILYATTVDDNTPATAVATVFAPTDLPAGPRPIIAWQHPTTGLRQRCMPSLFSAPSAGIPARDRIVKFGWIVVATDYSFAEKDGPHPYLIGEGEARAALDSVRAAREMSELELDNRIVVWGYSQGGHSALWTGIVGPRYAPELEIVGVAGIAPPTNLRRNLEASVDVEKLFGPYIAAAYSRFYGDIKFEEAVRPEALKVAREMTGLCNSFPPEESRRMETLAGSLGGPALAISSNNALRTRLDQNTPDGWTKAPVVIAAGTSDNVVASTVTDAYVKERCTAGQRMEYWKFLGRDHFSIIQPGNALEEMLVRWTAARFANEPEQSGCVFVTIPP